jgi:hypothetical protein
MENKKLFRVQFLTGKKEFDIKALQVKDSEFFGFLEISDFVLTDPSKVVITPEEDELKKEFEGIKRILVPYQHIRRIDEYNENEKKIVSPFLKIKNKDEKNT